jgi:hypothetical protein
LRPLLSQTCGTRCQGGDADGGDDGRNDQLGVTEASEEMSVVRAGGRMAVTDEGAAHISECKHGMSEGPDCTLIAT